VWLQLAQRPHSMYAALVASAAGSRAGGFCLSLWVLVTCLFSFKGLLSGVVQGLLQVRCCWLAQQRSASFVGAGDRSF
jgi:hypothetical protein